MLNIFARLCFELVVSSLLAHGVCSKKREGLLPYVFSFFVAWWPTALVLGPTGPARVIGNFVNILCTAYILSFFTLKDISKKNVIGVFCVFWSYGLIAMFFGQRAFYGFMFFLSAFVDFVLPAFVFVCVDRGRNKYWNTALSVLVVISLILSIVYYRASTGGGVDMELKAFSRVGVLDEYGEDAGLNVNSIGLIAVTFVPICFVFLIEPRMGLMARLIKLIACGSVLVWFAVLVRTGSRNSLMMVVPLAWYLLFGGRRQGVLKKAFLVGGVVLICFVSLCVLSGAGYLDELRIFNFDFASGDISTGRLDWHRRELGKLNWFNFVFGGGAFLDFQSGGVIANGHSIFFQTMYQSGLVGVALFLVFLFKYCIYGILNKVNGKIALMFIGVWLFTGIGESVNIIRAGFGAKIYLGLGLGLLSCRSLCFYERGKL